MKRIAVAIDGPAAAGKSTVAKIVSDIFGYTYIDTGAMYRAFTYYVLKSGLDPQREEDSVKVINDVHIDLLPNGVVLCNNEDVTSAIRSSEVSNNVSYIASYKDVRLALVEQQRRMAQKTSVVMDGRDIGTYVLPNAEVKIYQIASVETRAIRRYEENRQKGITCTLKEIEEDLRRRDHLDSTRAFAPLKPAPDSILLDTSNLTILEAVEQVVKIINAKLEVL